MPTYALKYIVDADNDTRTATLSLDRPACELDIAQAAALDYRSEQPQAIGNIMDSLSEPSELPPHFDLMAQLGILQILYTIDDGSEEHNL